MPNGACVLVFCERKTRGSNLLSNDWKVLFHLLALRTSQKPSSESEAQGPKSQNLIRHKGQVYGEERYRKISAAGFRRDVMKNDVVNVAVLGLLCVQAVVWRE